MQKLICFFFVLFFSQLLIAQVNTNAPTVQSDKNKCVNVKIVSVEDIQNIISQKDFTILYFYTTWCSACKAVLRTDIKKALDTLNVENLTVAIVGLGESIEKIELLSQECKIGIDNYYLENSTKNAFSNKKQINKTLKKILKGYKFANYVPVTILCAKDFNVIEQSGFSYLLTRYYELNKKQKQ